MLATLIMAATMATDTVPREEVIVVTATRGEASLREQAGNTALIGDEDLERIAAIHPSEIFARAPGIWVTRGSNQEHLTALRSPILTGPGACGAFLFLEDGLPVRPAGFCNVNQLIELNLEQARAIEVVRGPGSALYGSNALHGLINVITRSPFEEPAAAVTLDGGPDGFLRLRGTGVIGGETRVGGLYARDDGWRDASGHEQMKLYLRHEGESFSAAFAASWLEQDTAAFIVGQDTYRNLAVARSNPTPDAFRDMDAQRASVHWRHEIGDWSSSMRPYARRSRMAFLQHFIPGQPVEENGHHSIGLQWLGERPIMGSGRLLTGADLEYADIEVLQFQAEPLTDASPFLNETRPQGRHYDFRVAAITAAAFTHAELPLGETWRLTAGLRVEHTRYDYENRMAAGNLREDGTACGMGGCLYNRPADRADDFTVAVPKLGVLRRLNADNDLYLSVTRGHRAPQVNELYRLQRGQDAADLAPERMDALELGWRGFTGGRRYEVVAFTMRKRDVVFQDAAGFAVSDGRTLHSGLEFSLSQPLGAAFELALNGTLARHRYDSAHAIAGGETIARGAEIPAAPRQLASARLAWRPATGHGVELEAARTGAHWLDAANAHRYHGHTLLHLRGTHEVGGNWRLGWRVTNLTDRRYAERADFAFGDYRYFPGPPRSLWLSIGTI